MSNKCECCDDKTYVEVSTEKGLQVQPCMECRVFIDTLTWKMVHCMARSDGLKLDRDGFVL